MPSTNIGSAIASDLANAVTSFSVAPLNTDAAQGTRETFYQNTKFPQWFGYYKAIPELKKAIDMKAIWTVGNGYVADAMTTVILDHITGWGRDTFNSILKNMVITAQIGGDAFAEIIRDADTGLLLNLKPLDPSVMRVIADTQGIIIRYEQTSKFNPEGIFAGSNNNATGTAPAKVFQPDEIFHIVKDRVADELHGVSIVEACEKVILARNEVMADMRTTMHYHVKPRIAFKIDTDDPARIAAFRAKMDAAIALGENIYFPKDTVEFEIMAVPANATLNPMPWMDALKSFFFQAVGIPQIILGGAQEFTESTAKIAYLAFEQSVADEQQNIEEQCWAQLGYKIELEFPASLQNELISDNNKDAQGQMQVQQSDVTAGRGR